MEALGPELANKVNGCTLDGGRITVNADSPAWAARMRFALADAQEAIGKRVPGFLELKVRVRPSRPTRARR
jgi:hypothetical protein